MDLEDAENYRIFPLIDKTFNSNPITSVDFKRHLLATAALNKVSSKDTTGRPTSSEYYYNGALQAVVYFTFTQDSNNLLSSRTETLHYILNDGTEGLPIVIKSRTYNPSNSVDLELIVEERISARKAIISGMKGFILGVLMQYGHTQPDALAKGAEIWNAYEVDISNFTEFGTEVWKDKLTALDITTGPFTWLAYEIDANGTTLRDDTVSRLTY